MSKMRLTILTVFLIFNSAIFAFNFQNKIKDAISKAKSQYKINEKSTHFLRHDISEYPGTNKEFLKQQEQKWKNYYNCLKGQQEAHADYKSIIPEAITVIEGDSIKFECKICFSPSESSDIESVEWQWSHIHSEYLEPVEYGDHIVLSPKEKTLELYNVGFEQMGQYVCVLKKQLTSPYFLTVVNNSEEIKMVHQDNSPKGPYKEPAWKIHPDIILDTLWSNWSPCSTCGTVGKKYKHGFCNIIYLPNLNKSHDEIKVEEFYKNYTDLTANNTILLTNVEEEFLKIFQFGIPCQSYILLKSLEKLKELVRPNEIMTSYCKIKCPTEKVFVVKDKNGNVVETANNTAGIYSMLQGLPTIEPPVERRIQYEAAGTDVVLTCPGNINSDTPIHWQIKGKNVLPQILSQQSNGRLYISITDKIYIKEAKISDSGIYSCWQDKQLAGTIRVFIEKQINMNFNHHVILMGLVVIMLTFLYVIWKVISGRKYVGSAQ